MKNRDRDRHPHEDRGARHLRDTYNPEPQWLQQDRESRRFAGRNEDEVEYGIGGSQYGGNEYGYGGRGRGSYAGTGREWGENTQGYGRQGSVPDAGTNRDFGGRDYGERDRSRMREERDWQQRTYGGSSGGRDTYSGYGAQSRNAAPDYSTGYEAASYEDDDFGEGQQRGYAPFRVGTGMGLGSGRGDYGREREFGQGYGSSSGYGSRSGWDLGTHQRDFGAQQGTQRPSFRGMGPSHYKRSDDRIRDDIYERLTDSHVIDARGILVDVNEGNVTLTGTVVERRMRYAAEDLVERVGGVSNINNQLRVQQGNETRASSAADKSQQEDKRH